MAYSGYQDTDSVEILNRYQLLKEQENPSATSVIGGLGPSVPLSAPASASASTEEESPLVFWIKVVDPTGITSLPEFIAMSKKLWEVSREYDVVSMEFAYALTKWALCLYCIIPNLGLLAGPVAIGWGMIRAAVRKIFLLLKKAADDPKAAAKAVDDIVIIANTEILPPLNNKIVLDSLTSAKKFISPQYIDPAISAIKTGDIQKISFARRLFNFIKQHPIKAGVTFMGIGAGTQVPRGAARYYRDPFVQADDPGLIIPNLLRRTTNIPGVTTPPKKYDLNTVGDDW